MTLKAILLTLSGLIEQIQIGLHRKGPMQLQPVYIRK